MYALLPYNDTLSNGTHTHLHIYGAGSQHLDDLDVNIERDFLIKTNTFPNAGQRYLILQYVDQMVFYTTFTFHCSIPELFCRTVLPSG